jgi:hypothetical protein
MDFSGTRNIGEQPGGQALPVDGQGRRQLEREERETRKWDKLAGAIARILRPREQEGEL